MEYRCEWCGKPHAEDDPPCENCGHGTFEKAVVRQGPTEGQFSDIEWVCTECGRVSPRNNPPCSRCGNTSLESREVEPFEDVTARGYLELLDRSDLLTLIGIVVLVVGVALVVTGAI